jgi:hypothetical protein
MIGLLCKRFCEKSFDGFTTPEVPGVSRSFHSLFVEAAVRTGPVRFFQFAAVTTLHQITKSELWLSAAPDVTSAPGMFAFG